MRAASRLDRIALLALAFAALVAAEGRADLIFFKDGYVMQGKVRREATAELDSVTKEMSLIPKGFFMLDDGPRRIYFSQKQVRIVEKMAAPSDERVISRKGAYILINQPMPDISEVLEVFPWNYETWRRDFRFRAPGRSGVRLTQGLASITPYFARVDAVTRFPWSAAYLTREWDPEVVYKLLLHNPELMDPVKKKPGDKPPPRVKPRDIDKIKAEGKAKPGEKIKPGEKAKPEEKLSPKEIAEREEKIRKGMIAARRMRMCDFFAQAGWFDIADRELDRLLKDLPDEKERVARARITVDKLRARDLWEQTKNWYQAGRYDAVRKRLAAFPVKNVPDRIRADIREMKERLATSTARVAEADQALEKCSEDAKTTAKGRSLASAVGVIRAELHPSTVDRLDAFLGQVRDLARQKVRGKKGVQTPEGLLSLAVSGWLLGSPSAEAEPDVAINLWRTRRMVLDYLQETDRARRQKILASYERMLRRSVDLDEVAQLIDHLPPADPIKISAGQTVVREAGKGRQATTYSLRLPPEYSPSRQYPVLFVLPNTGEKPKDVIARWAKAADDNGYILASPHWDRLSRGYEYTAREHDTVIDTLRDLRRRFQIDSDRVFLHGVGEGGNMAFDVGLAHPDLFAGVLPMGAGPNFYPRRYWRNAQYLPFYVVSGTRAGESNKLLREQFEHWIPRSYPTLWIEYKGRGVEWFSGELPNMFDWMRNQRRTFPLRQVGTDGLGGDFGNEFCAMRPDDNRFYWLSTSDLSARNTLHPSSTWSNLVSPATITGQINPQTNDITLKTSGVGQVTIWLGRNPKGQYMVDFDKPISVRNGFRFIMNKRRVQPSLAVLMEDLYQRGDRKHLFVAKIEIDIRAARPVLNDGVTAK